MNYSGVDNTSALLARPSSKAMLTARQDRIPIWSLPKSLIWSIGIGYFATFFCITDINVPFIQTCTQIVPHCIPTTAENYIGLPVLMSLIGYVIGTFILSPLADRYGRRDILFVTLVIIAVGSLYSALINDYTNFVLSRTVTGMGIGADLAIVNTYIIEIAPTRSRAKYVSAIFTLPMFGIAIAIWLGLYLTTPATPFPLGLPFALAGAKFASGWRINYLIGSFLAIIGLLFRFQIPESPRWLIDKGRLRQAEHIIKAMEQRALTRMAALPQVSAELPVLAATSPFRDIFGTSLYLRRTIILIVVWLVGYITVYAVVDGLTVLLVAVHYPTPEAGLIAAIGTVGLILTSILSYVFVERIERKHWIAIAGALTLLGGVIIALGAASFLVTILGAIMIFCGINLWVPAAYSWSLENYATRARATGFAIVDGIGHVGGGIGLTFIASLTGIAGPLLTFIFIGSFLLLAAFVAQFGIATRAKRLDEVSP